MPKLKAPPKPREDYLDYVLNAFKLAILDDTYLLPDTLDLLDRHIKYMRRQYKAVTTPDHRLERNYAITALLIKKTEAGNSVEEACKAISYKTVRDGNRNKIIDLEVLTLKDIFYQRHTLHESDVRGLCWNTEEELEVLIARNIVK